MPLFKKIKAKAKNCRGGGDDFIIKEFEENYKTWMEAIAGESNDNKQEVERVFNEVCDDLGTAMLGDEAEFKMIRADMTAGQVTEFCRALVPEYFELAPETD